MFVESGGDGGAKRSSRISQEQSLIAWSGIAGVLGGLLFVATILILLVLVPAAPSGTAGPISQYPSVRNAVVIGEVVDLAAVVLWVMLFLGLYRALREESLAAATFGGGVGLIGLVLLAAGGIPGVAFTRLSDLYHAAGASAQDQSTLAFVWQGVQGIFNETDTVGFILFMIGFILLGAAMVRTAAFGRGFGIATSSLGMIGLIGIALFPVDSTAYAPFGILAFIVLPILVGWRLLAAARSLSVDSGTNGGRPPRSEPSP